jgi:hypothetical protein
MEQPLAAAQAFTNVNYEGNILWGAAAPGTIPPSGFRRGDGSRQSLDGFRIPLGSPNS